MSTIPDLLRQAPLLDGVSAEAIEALGAHAELVELAQAERWLASNLDYDPE